MVTRGGLNIKLGANLDPLWRMLDEPLDKSQRRELEYIFEMANQEDSRGLCRRKTCAIYKAKIGEGGDS